jgi:hypothetical protein
VTKTTLTVAVLAAAMPGCSSGGSPHDSAPPPPQTACEGAFSGPFDADAPLDFWGPSLRETLDRFAFAASGTAERIDGETAPVRLELGWDGSGPAWINLHEHDGECAVYARVNLTIDRWELDGVPLQADLGPQGDERLPRATLILRQGEQPRLEATTHASASGIGGSLLEPPSGRESAWFVLDLSGVPPDEDGAAWFLQLDATEPTGGTWDSVQEEWPFIRATLAAAE